MRTIKVSENVWNEIAKRGKFGETEDDVLKRVFGLDDTQVPLNNKIDTMPITNLVTKDLNKTKPRLLYIEDTEYRVKSWVEVCEYFVSYLIEHDYLSHRDLPISNYSENYRVEKYFINRKPQHSLERIDGEWKNVKGFYIDIKYNSINHVKNIITTLEQLDIKNLKIRLKVDFSIT